MISSLLRNRIFSVLNAPGWVCCIFAALCLLLLARVSAGDRELLEALKRVEPGDSGYAMALDAVRELQASRSISLTQVLEAMNDATPLGRNWLMGLAHTVRRNGTKTDSSLGQSELQDFLKNTKHHGEARALVFLWLTRDKDKLRQSMLETMLDDPSPELRYAAVQQALERLEASSENKLERLRQLLESAMHPEQVSEIIKLLNAQGEGIVLGDFMGFLKNWDVIGPFDNVGQAGFDVAYPIEKDLIQGKFSTSDVYQGKNGEVRWKKAECNPEDGTVDLNPIFNNEKGAIVYARATFHVASDMPADVRLGSINANKAWLNGELIISNEVYHASQQMDQYIYSGRLKSGENVLVVKVCQNEQTEAWAQNWSFLLRICDDRGRAIHSMP